MSTSKTPAQIKSYYLQKAKASFKARFDLLLYHRVTNGITDEITPDYLDKFKIEKHLELLDEYIHIYWQKENIKENKINGKTIEDIYLEMKKWRDANKPTIDSLLNHYIRTIFKEVFPEEQFIKMVNDARECDYCHITKEKIDNLIVKKKLFNKHITRGWSFEIDRKEANLEYTKDNCVPCCYWCNNAKTDEFSHPEFKKVGAIFEIIWNDRLSR